MKIRDYLLKPYDLRRRTFCMLYFIWKYRREIYLEYRMAGVESQDRMRVLREDIRRFLKMFAELDLATTYSFYLQEMIENEG